MLWAGGKGLYRARPNHFQAQTVSVVSNPERSGQPGGDDQQARHLVTRLRDHRVDGGSVDGTAELARNLGCRVLTHPAGRGGQLRAGAPGKGT